MKILHVNTYDRGGAANACIRLHLGLLAQGVDSNLLILQRFEKKTIPNCSVFNLPEPRKRSLLERGVLKIFPWLKKNNKKDRVKKSIRQLIPGTLEWFSFPDTAIDITTHPLYKEADVINLHWVSDFIDYSFFEKNKKPVIWTLHDMNAFTGGCHYSFTCDGYKKDCTGCPQLQTINENDFSLNSFLYKEKYLKVEQNTTIVTPSRWLGNVAKESNILKDKKVLTIPYGIESKVFQPHDRTVARKILGLPEDKKIILFVSFYLLNNKRKGYEYLVQSLDRLSEFSNDTVLCVVGGKSNLKNQKFQIFENENISDERLMSLFYAAADVFVIPSIDDNLPNTVLESIMCGTPVVGFAVGGIKDMVIEGKNGYLANEISDDSLSEAVGKFLKDPSALEYNRDKIREDALRRYDSPVQANAYKSLYLERINVK